MRLFASFLLLAAVAAPASAELLGAGAAPPSRRGRRSQVVGAVVVYRHGDRTPIDPYPTDPYADPKYWPVPFGELTPGGMRRHYELGATLRDRYEHLIGDKFDVSKIYVRSTDVDRTLMSAMANMAGMYPVEGSDEFVPDLPWRPTPIHTLPQNMDSTLMMSAPCPNFDDELERLLATDFFRNLTAGFEPLFRYVSMNTQRKIENIEQLSYIYDVLLIEHSNNLTLPDWTRPIFPEKLVEVSKWNFVLDTYTPKLARLRAGPLVKLITENLMRMQSGEVTQRLFVYSAHDTTIARILNALRLRSFVMAPFAASLIFELDSDGRVRVLYQMEDVPIPQCGDACPLDRWVSKYRGLFPVDHESECGLGSGVFLRSTAESMVLIYLLMFLAVCILVMNLITCWIMKRSRISDKSKDVEG